MFINRPDTLSLSPETEAFLSTSPHDVAKLKAL